MAFEAEAEAPLRVAQGLLFKRKKQSQYVGLGMWSSGPTVQGSKKGNVHVPIRTQRLTDVTV